MQKSWGEKTTWYVYKSKDLGLGIHGLFLGAFAHADDIRTTTTNPDDTAEQVKTVASFADRNGLKLSTEKCGIVIAGRGGMVPWCMVVFQFYQPEVS